MIVYLYIVAGLSAIGLTINLVNVYRAYEGTKYIAWILAEKKFRRAAQLQDLQADEKIFRKLLALSSMHCFLFALLLITCLVAVVLTNQNINL